jgi:hypothetical protein
MLLGWAFSWLVLDIASELVVCAVDARWWCYSLVLVDDKPFLPAAMVTRLEKVHRWLQYH